MISLDVKVEVTEGKGKKRIVRPDNKIEEKLTLAELFEFTKGALVDVSRKALSEELAKGFDQKYKTFVDGRNTKVLETVSPLGKIEFVSSADFAQIVIDAYIGVEKRSPIDTGYYSDSHVLVFRDRVVASTRQEVLNWFKFTPITLGPRDSFLILNTTPYAARLERIGSMAGREKRKPKTYTSESRNRKWRGRLVSAPNGAYFVTTAAIRRKWKKNANIYFQFVNGARIADFPRPAFHPYGRRQKLRYSFHPSNPLNKGPYTFPSILIVPTDGRTI